MISVTDYLNKVKLAKRSPQTIKGYQKVLKSFADYLDIPVDDLHNHLTSDNLANYAAVRINGIKDEEKSTRKKIVWIKGKEPKSPAGTGTNLRIIHGFYKENGIEIKGRDLDIILNPGCQQDEGEDIGDKPLTTELLQRMMDQGNPHSRAIITTLISTGMRAGECSKLVLSNIGRLEGDAFIPDINSSVINIPHSIAKGKVVKGKKTGGGLVFLTDEARQYLTEWLRERDQYITSADKRAASLKSGPKPKKGEKDTRPAIIRPENDQRIFAVSYNSMHRIWDRLYKKCDGEKGTYQSRCTLHSTRRYFRTNAGKNGISLDLIEKIMRHHGYLTKEYVKIPDMEKQFHTGESALYITRADHRIQGSKLDQLQRENASLQERLKHIEQTPTDNNSIISKLSAKIDAMQLDFEALNKLIKPINSE